jgi:hypothetical protein
MLGAYRNWTQTVYLIVMFALRLNVISFSFIGNIFVSLSLMLFGSVQIVLPLLIFFCYSSLQPIILDLLGSEQS